VWVMIREEQEKIKELEKELAARREGTPSSEDLEKWLKSSGAKRFCKRAATAEEEGPEDKEEWEQSEDWWKGEPEPKPEPMEEKPWYANLKLPGGLQEDLPFVPFWAKKMKFDPKELDVVPQLTKPENEYTLNINNIKDKMRDFALNIYPKKIVEINKGLIEKGMKPIFSYEDALESDNHLPLEFLEEYQNDVSPSVYSEEMHNALALEETGFDPIGQAWEDLAGEEPGKGREFSGIEKEVDRRIKELTKDQNREVNPSAEDLEKWLKSSGAKRFCKRADRAVLALMNPLIKAIETFKRALLNRLPLNLVLYARDDLIKEFEENVKTGEQFYSTGKGNLFLKDVVNALRETIDYIETIEQSFKQTPNSDSRIQDTLNEASILLNNLKVLDIKIKTKYAI